MLGNHIYLAVADFRILTQETEKALYQGTDAAQGNFFVLLGTLINVLISILGVILLFFIVTAGFYWFTAGGDSGQVDKAKKLLYNSIIGMVLIMVAYSLSTFVQRALIDRLTQAPADTVVQESTTP